MTSNHSVLEIKDIHKNYEGAPLLKGISFKVENGETFCLLGRSGSGKSTLLRIIAGLETADSGDVIWNGQNMNGVPAYQRNFGLMFQDYALFPHMNVSENVAFGLRMKGMARPQIASAVKDALDLVNMGGFAERSVTDLSGGEQQRIALARALAPKPHLLMLDEPLAALDRALRMEIQEELRSLLKRAGIPAIYVTHDQEEALLLGDRVAILADGRIEQSGKPEEVYHAPKNRKVAEFLGMTNFVDGQVLSTQPLTVKTALGMFTDIRCSQISTKVGEQVTLLIPTVGAKLIQDEKSPDRIAGMVTECVFRGNDYRICLKIDQSISMTFILAEPCAVNHETALYFSRNSILCLEN